MCKITEVELRIENSPKKEFNRLPYVHMKIITKNKTIFMIPYLKTLDCLSFKLFLFLELLGVNPVNLERGYIKKYEKIRTYKIRNMDTFKKKSKRTL